MLVLSRTRGETIIIGDSVKVTVVDIDRGKVRIGVDADRDIPVWRGEIWEQIKETRKPE